LSPPAHKAGAPGAGAHGPAPLWRRALALSLLSLAGAGPFAVLASELLVVQAAAGAGAWAALALFLVGASMAFVAVLKHVVGALDPAGDAPGARRASRAEVACVLVPFVLLVAVGLAMPPALHDVLSQAAAAVGGGGA
jgi:formate hydrogenlyase subunit 3/multisubunit Na+/H+ antiporter MnhD subunit